MTDGTRAMDRPTSANGFFSGVLFGGLLGAVAAAEAILARDGRGEILIVGDETAPSIRARGWPTS